jgi:nitrate/nitrite transport system ATP-binding protein
VTVNLPRPRNRVEMAESAEYMRYRKAVLSFLYERHGRKATPVPAADEEAQPARGNVVELKKVPAKAAA